MRSPSQKSQCPGYDTKWAPPNYKTDALQLALTCSVDSGIKTKTEMQITSLKEGNRVARRHHNHPNHRGALKPNKSDTANNTFILKDIQYNTILISDIQHGNDYEIYKTKSCIKIMIILHLYLYANQ